MSNSYFQFKQFRVEQAGAVMKVCTDSCIFGAFAARFLADEGKDTGRVLDIGTGTGLLSLMIAQRCKAHIDAIELDETACRQAEENFQQSPWEERLHLYQGDIRRYGFIKKYDLIISNPPFYEDDLKSIHPGKNQAKHDTVLNYEGLLVAVKNNLSEGGKFAVLLPYRNQERFCRQAAANGFCLQEALFIRQTPDHDFFRIIGIFGMKKKKTVESTLVIKDEHGQYTPEFAALLQEYYLYL